MPGPDAIVRRLLAWFARAARDLPWRRTREPYAIWISEVMLQQTQVQTVIPYWQRWMRALPTVRALARAEPARVLKLWEGLGYYTRARNLQRAARLILTRHAGRFPSEFGDVLALPGIGRYTAGAICSVAFNQPTPVLDGNVCRVLARVFGVNGRPARRATNQRLWSLAHDLVERAARVRTTGRRACADLNQALMELGATVCTPRDPHCPKCPLRRCCVARRTGRVDRLPQRDRRDPATPRHFVAFVLERRGRFWVRQRPTGGVNAGLWEFPNVETASTSRPSDVEAGLARNLAASRLSLPVLAWEPFDRIRHTITRYRITMDVFRATWTGSRAPVRDRDCWGSWAELNRLPFTSAHGRILRQLKPRPARTLAPN